MPDGRVDRHGRRQARDALGRNPWRKEVGYDARAIRGNSDPDPDGVTGFDPVVVAPTALASILVHGGAAFAGDSPKVKVPSRPVGPPRAHAR